MSLLHKFRRCSIFVGGISRCPKLRTSLHFYRRRFHENGSLGGCRSKGSLTILTIHSAPTFAPNDQSENFPTVRGAVWSGGKAWGCLERRKSLPATHASRGEVSTGTQKFSKMVPLTSCVPKNENGKWPYPPASRADKRSAEGVGAHCRVRV